MLKQLTLLVSSLLVSFIFSTCSEKSEDFDNPFNDPNLQPPTDTTSNTITLSPTSLAGLHQNIFIPTCANSGCHDGTFEPDFRTIESTYNTTVNHPALKTDPNLNISQRIVPNQPEQSMLYYRLLNFLPNSSGKMPLEANDSDWPDKKEEHIQNIRTWIENGAENI